MIVPEMGTTATTVHSGLASALFTPVQQRVLGLLFGQPDRRFQSAELIRLAESGTGAVHRQLQRLAAAGLVEVSREGNQKYYQAIKGSPIFADLHGLAIKTFGIVGPLTEALAPLADRIDAAFVFGSIAKGSDRGASDIDLFIVADTVTYPDLYSVLEGVEATLGRPVKPTVLTKAEWRERRGREDSFVARVASQPRLFVIGSRDELG
jgi:predicted nucleotidyltransferase